MANIVAIVGRPNVGKSTLFNRLVEQRDAIVDDQSGVTRDRHYGRSVWNGYHFSVIDTGGYVVGSEDVFEGAIREQVEMAIEEASVLLFVVDVLEGLHPLDQDFAHVLRKSKKPVYLVANKADTHDRSFMTGEFYALGFEEIYPMSALNGMGSGELLDQVTQHFGNPDDESAEQLPRIAVIGRPNVGKSSFVNLLLNRQRSIVTDIAGTTRDSIHAEYNAFGKRFLLTDTAGIRKKAKVKENIEFYSVLRSLKAIEDSDVCILMLDASQGLEGQDLSILHQAQKFKKGVMIMVNKWDLIEKDTKTAIEYEKAIKERLKPNTYIPVIFTSVLTKQRVFKTIEKAIQIYENRFKKVPTSELNDKLLKEIERYPPPATRGRQVKIKYITQLPIKSPTFAFFCNYPKDLKEPYARFLENRMREHFDFDGVPIKIVFRKK